MFLMDFNVIKGTHLEKVYLASASWRVAFRIDIFLLFQLK